MIATEVKKEYIVSNNSLITEMRESRESANVAFITFCSNYRKYPNHIFCFYEGEDGKYYNQRIKSVIGDNIITIKSGDKFNTLKAWRRISKDTKYDSINKMFFVDRDMDDLPDDIDDNLYVTPCYSIENLYVSIESFANIIETEFSISKTDDDYKKCIDLFVYLYHQFCELMIEFNALVLVRKNKHLGNGKVCLSAMKTTQMIKVELSEVAKGGKYDSLIGDLKEKLQVTDEEMQNAIETIQTQDNYGNYFRGKNQLDFLVALIALLKKANNTKTFFTQTRNCVSIDLTNNRLSELSQYAQTPDCLTDFIKKHKFSR